MIVFDYFRADEARERVLKTLQESLEIIYRDQAVFIVVGFTFEDYLNKLPSHLKTLFPR